jgi:DNA-binding transcriptional MerR regulator
MTRETRNLHASAFKKTSSALGNTLEVCRKQIKDLRREIRADELGKKEFEEHMGLLKRQRHELERRTRNNMTFAKEFDEAIGPFERKYGGLTGEISGLYDNAKEEHAKGVQLLINEFGYHPPFKRWDDAFSATPFKPK